MNDSGLILRCPCGREIKTIQEALPIMVEFDEDNDLIFALCIHGSVIFDKKALYKRRN
jgi:hypothetical protein